MSKTQRSFLILFIVSLAASAGPVSSLVSAYKNDYYWTHMKMKLPLSAGDNYFQIYIQGQRLQNILNRGELFLNKNQEIKRLVPEDFAVRLNKIHELTRWSLVSAVFFLTAGLIFLALFLITLWGKWPPKPSAPEPLG